MSDQQQYQPQPQQGSGWQPPQPQKKRHPIRNTFLVLAGLGVLTTAGCLAFAGTAVNDIDQQSKEVHTVVYSVTGTSKVGSLTYNTDGVATIEQVTAAKLPWSKTLKVSGLALIYQLSVQNGVGQTGTVVCTITVDDKIVKTATAKGEGANASCTN